MGYVLWGCSLWLPAHGPLFLHQQPGCPHGPSRSGGQWRSKLGCSYTGAQPWSARLPYSRSSLAAASRGACFMHGAGRGQWQGCQLRRRRVRLEHHPHAGAPAAAAAAAAGSRHLWPPSRTPEAPAALAVPFSAPLWPGQRRRPIKYWTIGNCSNRRRRPQRSHCPLPKPQGRSTTASPLAAPRAYRVGAAWQAQL